MAQSRTTVPLGLLSAGAVIGRGGSNVKWLSAQASGAVELGNRAAEAAGGGGRVDVGSGDGVAVITGRSREAVERAAALLRAQVEANARLCSPAYPHPLRVDTILLQTAYGPDPTVHFEARSASDEVARATGRKEQLHVMAPSAGGGGRGGGGGGDELAELLGGVSLIARPGPSTSAAAAKNGAFYSGRAALGPKGPVAAALSAAAHTAAAHTPAFSVIKLRFNLGKQFFFNLPSLQATTL
ncbi:hypothetical protein HYH03_005980 [Edaphochlamys debaryana]|uniref:K Homology domain-containing protein n=1 Tax=Edaphochlamys debaryana TaxID=47281 RepID=A0A836C0P5_9CHLO|nr:hypothetical protein HYH03_005980 [Edaphochlamys debaryana]|eukprot:KAG2496061.1 hypothetical protein HYH03_005980 [Edaphochlamys debaryana]